MRSKRNIISYDELSEDWQKEARSNSEDFAEISYLEPTTIAVPGKHILWDLSECMRVENQDYDGVIGISNNSALAVKLSDYGEVAEIWFL